MIHRRQVLAGLAVTVLASPGRAAASFRPLFDGRSLQGWSAIGDANWAVKDGLIQADKGTLGLLVSQERFRDFELRAEFWVSEEANSGIFLRCANRAEVTPANSYEVNIFDRRPDPSYGTGAIVDVAKASSAPKTGGRWSTMLIRAEGDRLDVTLNGVKTVEGARNTAHAEGPVALQYGAGLVKFRTVEIRAL